MADAFLFPGRDGMNVFEAVKENVTARQAAEMYGIRVNRNGMACCPFHDDRNPSLKVDKRFHCFGCQADGDVIDFVAGLYGLPGLEAAKKLAADFGIPYESRGGLPRSQPDGACRRNCGSCRHSRNASGCLVIISACWSVGKQRMRRNRRMTGGTRCSWKPCRNGSMWVIF